MSTAYPRLVRALAFGSAFAVVALPTLALAAFENPIKVNSVEEFLVEVLRAAAKIGGVVAAICIMWAGFLYVTAQGDEGKISRAHSAFRYAVIGTVLMLGASVFANVICKTLVEVGGSTGGSTTCPNI